MSELPKQINAIRAVTYSVDTELLEAISEINDIKPDEVTMEHLVEHVADWAIEDLASSHVKVSLQDENGIEIGTL